MSGIILNPNPGASCFPVASHHMPVPPQTFVGIAQDDTNALRERLRSTTAAYSRFVPREFLNLLGIEDIRKVEVGQQVERKMTILFADIRNFTSLSESMSPQENFNFLNAYLVQMEPVIAAHGGDFEQNVDSMQVEHEQVTEAKVGDAVGLKVSQLVKEGDRVYLKG